MKSFQQLSVPAQVTIVTGSIVISGLVLLALRTYYRRINNWIKDNHLITRFKGDKYMYSHEDGYPIRNKILESVEKRVEAARKADINPTKEEVAMFLKENGDNKLMGGLAITGFGCWIASWGLLLTPVGMPVVVGMMIAAPLASTTLVTTIEVTGRARYIQFKREELIEEASKLTWGELCAINKEINDKETTACVTM